MTKIELRQQFLTRRKALTTDQVTHQSREISRLFFDYLGQIDPANQPTVLHTFLPIQRQNEIDTWLIVRRIWELYPKIQLSASVTDTATNQLTHYPLLPTTPLLENRWGIPEPQDQHAAIESDQVDMVLIPLLAFDERGNRIGYGKGYYDRFLAGCRLDCQKIGLSLFEPVDYIDDLDLTDIPLDACITPERIRFF